MRFSLDVRRSRKGDCLLLHYGTKQDPRLVMIDGGPSNVYGPHLKPRLLEIKTARDLGPADALPVDLLMISHVDDDHVQGILDLTREELQAMAAHRPRLLTVFDLWHNSFDALITHNTKPLTAALAEHFGEAAANGGAMSDDAIAQVEDESPESPEVVRGGLQVLASIAQGFQLRRDAEKLEYPLNAEFDGALIMARQNNAPIDFENGLTFTIVGPLVAELDDLRAKHVAWLRELRDAGKRPPAALAAYIDASVPNLSSLVVLAKAGTKRILLTGDARGDKILQGLELAALLEPGKKMKVDILKVPHHGSANNVGPDFFERIVASHYVFSGDGEHGNPERETLEMLFKARGKSPFIVHLTYPVDEIDTGRQKDWEMEQAKEKKRKQSKPNTVVRPDWSREHNSLAAFLESTPTSRQKVRIVDPTKPHVIDLLDRLGF